MGAFCGDVHIGGGDGSAISGVQTTGGVSLCLDFRGIHKYRGVFSGGENGVGAFPAGGDDHIGQFRRAARCDSQYGILSIEIAVILAGGVPGFGK